MLSVADVEGPCPGNAVGSGYYARIIIVVTIPSVRQAIRIHPGELGVGSRAVSRIFPERALKTGGAGRHQNSVLIEPGAGDRAVDDLPVADGHINAVGESRMNAADQSQKRQENKCGPAAVSADGRGE